VIKAKKDIAIGINMVKDRLLVKDDGLPGIFFDARSLVTTDKVLSKRSDPVRTTDEFLSYSWSKNKADIPQDAYNHGMDAMRYMVMHLSSRGGYRVRFL
jgi:hypothetical protein